MWYVVTALIALACGYAFLKCKIPAGAIIGGMVGVALFSLATDRAATPAILSPLVLCVMGTFIGADLTKEDVGTLKKLMIPVLLLLSSLLFFSLLSSFAMYQFSDLDLVTALFGAAPAGIVDITLIAESFGGDMPIIAMLQTIRVALIVTLFPFVFSRLLKRKHAASEHAEHLITIQTTRLEKTPGIKNAMVTLGCGLSFGMLAHAAHIPAGAMTFSMLSVSLLNLTTGRAYVSKHVQRVFMCFGGAVIGMRFTYDSFLAFSTLWPMVLIMLSGLMLISLVTGYLLHHFFRWDLATALFSAAPGGISDIAVISREYGANKTIVAFMQLCRFIGMILIYPYILFFYANS